MTIRFPLGTVFTAERTPEPYRAGSVLKHGGNRPFPSSFVPLFQNEFEYETSHVKMSSTCSFILMQIKVISIRMVSHSLRLALKLRHKETRKWPISCREYH